MYESGPKVDAGSPFSPAPARAPVQKAPAPAPIAQPEPQPHPATASPAGPGAFLNNAVTTALGWLADFGSHGKGAAAATPPATPDEQQNKGKFGFKDGAASYSKQQTTTDEDGVSTTAKKSVSAGKSGLSVATDTTKTGGDDGGSTGSGKSATVDLNGVSLKSTSTSSTGTADNGTSASSASGVGYGKNGATMGYTQTATATQDGKSTTTGSSNINVGIDPGKGSATLSGGVTQGDYGATGSLQVSANDTRLSVGGSAKGASVSLTYDNQHGAISSDAKAAGDGSAASQALGNSGYVAATRTDSTTLGGKADLKAVNFGGSVTNGSTFQVFDQLPANWNQMQPDEQKQYKEKETQRLSQINGLSDVNLTNLADGSGVHYTSYNGWNASAGITYGAIGINGGIGQSTEQDVTIAKKDGALSFSVAHQAGVSDDVGLSVFGKGMDISQAKTNTHGFEFKVDPDLLDQSKPDKYNPETAKAVQTFMQTGLIPGADKLDGAASKTAYDKFQKSTADVDSLTKQISDLKQQTSGPADQAPDANAITAQQQQQQQQQQQLSELYQKLSVAQTTIDSNRNYLNDQRQTQAKVDQPLAPGIKVSQVADSQNETDKLSVAGFNVGQTDISWQHQQYLSAQNTVEDRYGFDEKHSIFNNFLDEESTQTDTAKNGVVWAMTADNKVGYSDSGDAIKSIRNRNVPDYMLTKENSDLVNLRGRTTVSLTQQTLNSMTANLNDMNNPQSRDLWQDFSSRTSAFMNGDKFWKDSGNNADMTKGSMEAQRFDYMRTLTDPQLADKNDPRYQALASYGGRPDQNLNKAAQEFQAVKSPADFQKLDPSKQKLFIDLLENTSGSNHDFSGTRNSYEAVAAISLIQDPKMRAQELRGLFVDANQQSKRDDSDGVQQFVKFSGRFKDSDPATYNLLQQGMQFDWKQDDISAKAKQTPDKLAENMRDVQHLMGRDSDEALRLLEAANMQGGAPAVEKLIAEGHMNLRQDMEELSHNPAMQHMYADLVKETRFANDVNGQHVDYKDG